MSKNRIFKTKKYTSKKAILAVAAFVVLAVLVPGILFANHYINKDVPAVATINDEKSFKFFALRANNCATPTPTPTPTPPTLPWYVKETMRPPQISKGNENESGYEVKNGKIAFNL